MGGPLISIDGLWKKFPRRLEAARRYTLRDGLGELLDRRRGEALREEEIWALRDIGFEVRRGECFGVIGPNGAGKTTLLRAIAGQLKPDRGTVTTRGRVDRLTGLGGGFEPLLSGRENLRLRASLLGIAGRDLDALLDEVVDFAELHDVIDSPVQFYSSGMMARLGFAVSTMVEPDVLLLDEVLAVGDLAFRLKCYDRIFDMMSRAAVVFVSHSMAQVARVCTSACLLERGRVSYIGEVDRAIEAYHESLELGRGKHGAISRNAGLLPVKVRIGGEAIAGGECEVPYGAEASVIFDTAALPPKSLLRVIIRETGGRLLSDWSSIRAAAGRTNGGCLACDLGPLELRPGWYTLVVNALDADGRKVLVYHEPARFRVTGAFVSGVPIQRASGWRRVADFS